MPGPQHRELTKADKHDCFRKATRNLPVRYASAIVAGMTDQQLEEALEEVLGIFGGSSAPGERSVAFTGAGLRIWGGWHIVNTVTEKPLFAGRATIAMARQVHGVIDPNKKQIDLF
jgi:hypothetical protein